MSVLIGILLAGFDPNTVSFMKNENSSFSMSTWGAASNREVRHDGQFKY
jgi:hypothetical protein